MSDMAEYCRERRERHQLANAKRLKDNTEILLLIVAELDVEVKAFTDHHFRVTHDDGRFLDYWPSTQKGCWIKDKQRGKAFRIKHIDLFLLKHFKS